jgi:ABC-type sugar transport system substrate-binding protein
MKKPLATAASAFALLLPAAIGFASPAEAAKGFTMPSIDGMNLQEAEDAVEAAANGAPLQLASHNITGMSQKQLSLTDWLVCDQTPSAGKTFTSATDIDFGVVREFDAARNTYDPMVAEACD